MLPWPGTPSLAALLARVGAGIHESMDEGVAQTVRLADTYESNPERHEQYLAKYEIFKELYPTLAELNHRM